jgi:hypothetical protein
MAMSTMNDSEIRFWNQRLADADRLWRRRGYAEDSPELFKISRYLDAYKGIRPEYSDLGAEFVDDGLIQTNVFYATVNVLLASLFARDPQCDVFASDPAASDGARAQENLINHLTRSPKLRHKREFNRVLFDATLLNFGVLIHGYTPQAEKARKGRLLDPFDAALGDFPYMRRAAPWDVRIDPLAEIFDPDVAMWFAYDFYLPLDAAKEHPALIARDDLKPTRAKKLRESVEKTTDEEKLVHCRMVYDKRERKRFILSPGSSKPLMEPESWPIKYASLPYTLLQFNQVPGDPFGTTYSEQILPIQSELNHALQIVNQLSQSIRRITFIDKSSLDERESKKLSNLELIEVLLTNGDPKQAVFQTQLGGVPQELMLYITFLIGQIREILGVSEMERGQRMNVETAAEVSQVSAGASTQRGRNQGPWEDFLSEAYCVYGEALQAVPFKPVAVPVLGEEDASAAYAEIGPENIRGEFVYRVRPGSTLPRNPNAEAQKEIALTEALKPFGALVNMKQRAVDTVLAFDKSPRTQLIENQPAPAPGVQEMLTNGNAGVQPGVVSLIRQGAAGGAR